MLQQNYYYKFANPLALCQFFHPLNFPFFSNLKKTSC